MNWCFFAPSERPREQRSTKVGADSSSLAEHDGYTSAGRGSSTSNGAGFQITELRLGIIKASSEITCGASTSSMRILSNHERSSIAPGIGRQAVSGAESSSTSKQEQSMTAIVAEQDKARGRFEYRLFI